MELVIERRAVTASGVLDARLHPVLRRAYAARGVRDSQELTLTLDRLMPVSTLDGIEAAVKLILEHRERRILVVGDFDADGATSTALIVRCLRAWGFANVDFLVPNRFEFGYGLTPEIVGLAALRASVAHHHGRQWHLEHRRRRRGACARHPGAGHRSSSARRACCPTPMSS